MSSTSPKSAASKAQAGASPIRAVKGPTSSGSFSLPGHGIGSFPTATVESRGRSPAKASKPAWNGQNSHLFAARNAAPFFPAGMSQQLLLAQNQVQQLATATGLSMCQSPNKRSTFVEAHIVYISNLHPAFTDELLEQMLLDCNVPFCNAPRPKINDRPLSKETAGEVKFKDNGSLKYALTLLNGLDIAVWVKQNIFKEQSTITVTVNGKENKYNLEARRNIFAMKKMQRLQYETNMCERGVFTYQLQKINIQSSQELYQLFDDAKDIQKLIEQVRVAETRDKDGKAVKSRGCGHILFPSRAILADAQVHLRVKNCLHTPYTRPLNEATKIQDKTFLRNPTNIHIKNIPRDYSLGEGRKELEKMLGDAADNVHVGFARDGEQALRRLEIKNNTYGLEGFASFCYYSQAQQVVKELNGKVLERDPEKKPLRVEFFEKQETRQARLQAQKDGRRDGTDSAYSSAEEQNRGRRLTPNKKRRQSSKSPGRSNARTPSKSRSPARRTKSPGRKSTPRSSRKSSPARSPGRKLARRRQSGSRSPSPSNRARRGRSNSLSRASSNAGKAKKRGSSASPGRKSPTSGTVTLVRRFDSAHVQDELTYYKMSAMPGNEDRVTRTFVDYMIDTAQAIINTNRELRSVHPFFTIALFKRYAEQNISVEQDNVTACGLSMKDVPISDLRNHIVKVLLHEPTCYLPKASDIFGSIQATTGKARLQSLQAFGATAVLETSAAYVDIMEKSKVLKGKSGPLRRSIIADFTQLIAQRSVGTKTFTENGLPMLESFTAQFATTEAKLVENLEIILAERITHYTQLLLTMGNEFSWTLLELFSLKSQYPDHKHFLTQVYLYNMAVRQVCTDRQLTKYHHYFDDERLQLATKDLAANKETDSSVYATTSAQALQRVYNERAAFSHDGGAQAHAPELVFFGLNQNELQTMHWDHVTMASIKQGFSSYVIQDVLSGDAKRYLHASASSDANALWTAYANNELLPKTTGKDVLKISDVIASAPEGFNTASLIQEQASRLQAYLLNLASQTLGKRDIVHPLLLPFRDLLQQGFVHKQFAKMLVEILRSNKPGASVQQYVVNALSALIPPIKRVPGYMGLVKKYEPADADNRTKYWNWVLDSATSTPMPDLGEDKVDEFQVSDKSAAGKQRQSSTYHYYNINSVFSTATCALLQVTDSAYRSMLLSLACEVVRANKGLTGHQLFNPIDFACNLPAAIADLRDESTARIARAVRSCVEQLQYVNTANLLNKLKSGDAAQKATALRYLFVKSAVRKISRERLEAAYARAGRDQKLVFEDDWPQRGHYACMLLGVLSGEQAYSESIVVPMLTLDSLVYGSQETKWSDIVSDEDVTAHLGPAVETILDATIVGYIERHIVAPKVTKRASDPVSEDDSINQPKVSTSDSPCGQMPLANHCSEREVDALLRMAKKYSVLVLYNDISGSESEYYDAMLRFAARVAYDVYPSIDVEVRAKSDRDRYAASFVRDCIAQKVNRPGCFTPGAMEYSTFFGEYCRKDHEHLRACLHSELPAFNRYLSVKLSGIKFEDVQAAAEQNATDLKEKVKSLALIKARHVVNRDRTRTKHLHVLFSELQFLGYLDGLAGVEHVFYQAKSTAVQFKNAVAYHLRTFQYLSLEHLSSQMQLGNDFNRLYATHHLITKLALSAQAKQIPSSEDFCRDFVIFLRQRLIVPEIDRKMPKKSTNFFETNTVALASDFMMKAVQTYFDICMAPEKPKSGNSLQLKDAQKRDRRRSSTSDMRSPNAEAMQQYPDLDGAPYMLREAELDALMSGISSKAPKFWLRDLADKATVIAQRGITKEKWLELYNALLKYAASLARHVYLEKQELRDSGVTEHNFVLGFRRQIANHVYYPGYVSLVCEDLRPAVNRLLADDGKPIQDELSRFLYYTKMRRYESKYQTIVLHSNNFSMAGSSPSAAEHGAKAREAITAFLSHAMHSTVRVARTRKHVSHEFYSELTATHHARIMAKQYSQGSDGCEYSFRNMAAVDAEQRLLFMAKRYVEEYLYLTVAHLQEEVTKSTIKEKTQCLAHHIILKHALQHAKAEKLIPAGKEEHFCWHFYNYFHAAVQVPSQGTEKEYTTLAQTWANRFFNNGRSAVQADKSFVTDPSDTSYYLKPVPLDDSISNLSDSLIEGKKVVVPVTDTTISDLSIIDYTPKNDTPVKLLVLDDSMIDVSPAAQGDLLARIVQAATVYGSKNNMSFSAVELAAFLAGFISTKGGLPAFERFLKVTMGLTSVPAYAVYMLTLYTDYARCANVSAIVKDLVASKPTSLNERVTLVRRCVEVLVPQMLCGYKVADKDVQQAIITAQGAFGNDNINKRLEGVLDGSSAEKDVSKLICDLAGIDAIKSAAEA